jgi:hypothetical protein
MLSKVEKIRLAAQIDPAKHYDFGTVKAAEEFVGERRPLFEGPELIDWNLKLSAKVALKYIETLEKEIKDND